MLWKRCVRVLKRPFRKKLQNADVPLLHLERWEAREDVGKCGARVTKCKARVNGEKEKWKKVEQARRGQVKESSQPTGHQLQCNSNSTSPFPQPKCSHRTDFNWKSPIRDPCQTYANPEEKLSPYIKKWQGFSSFQIPLCPLNCAYKAKNDIHNHRHNTTIVKIMSHYEKEANMQSIT